MATFTVTTGQAVDEGEGLTLLEAVALAEATPGDDIINFDPSVEYVFKGDPINITGAGGAITINGDSDGDGISDVMLLGGNGYHMHVQSGATVTIVNVDFIGGSELTEGFLNGAAEGEWGQNAGLETPDGFDGADSLSDAADGGRGSDGEDDDDAIGSIFNEGELTLIRVGFGGNFAYSQGGQRGGRGGFGGDAGGGNGTNEEEIFSTPEPDDAFGDNQTIVQASNPGGPPAPGGIGGDGGTGAEGGRGGDGGDGGDAAGAIFNAEGAVLHLQDVVFGGRLSSGFVLGGNYAHGGNGGAGGGGGWGGDAPGGAGGNSNLEWTSLQSAWWDSPDEDDDIDYNHVILNVSASQPGIGGHGGIGGDGGDAGTTGDGGNAATIVNYGSADGSGAVSGLTDSDSVFANEVVAGNGHAQGGGGLGGTADGGHGGEQYLSSWSEWTPYLGYSSVVFDYPDEFDAWYSQYDYVITWYGPRQYRDYDNLAASGDDGTPGSQGQNGELGQDGEGALAIVNLGSGSDTSFGDSLVYLYDKGQSTPGSALTFNIIRVGDTTSTASVNWAVVADGANGVSAADFVGGVLPSGTVTFDPISEIPDHNLNAGLDYDSTNVYTITLDLAADGIDELPEGYRIVLTSNEGSSLLLGTSSATGTLLDADDSGADTGVIEGSTGDDPDLDGTPGDDEIHGLAGNDILNGGDGNDLLDGGDDTDTASYEGASSRVVVDLRIDGIHQNTRGAGTDTLVSIENLIGSDYNDDLKGGAGVNTLEGGLGDDVLRAKGDDGDILYGGDGDDVLRGDAGDNIMYGGAGEDVLIGAQGADEMHGGDDRDIMVGSSEDDEMYGDGGNDELRGNGGVDYLYGGDGEDDLRGGSLGDFLYGGADRDLLYGENANDLLDGGTGDDTMTGGIGADIFVYAIGYEFDRIRDFGDGNDQIDLSAIAGMTDLAAVEALMTETATGHVNINFGGGDILQVQNHVIADFDSGDFIYSTV